MPCWDTHLSGIANLILFKNSLINFRETLFSECPSYNKYFDEKKTCGHLGKKTFEVAYIFLVFVFHSNYHYRF